jgi:hypothetical protein
MEEVRHPRVGGRAPVTSTNGACSSGQSGDTGWPGAMPPAPTPTPTSRTQAQAQR